MRMIIRRVRLFWPHVPDSKHDTPRSRLSALPMVSACLRLWRPLPPLPQERPIHPCACVQPFKYRGCVLVYIKVILIQYHSLIFILNISQKAFGPSSVGLIPRFVVGLAATVNGISFSTTFSSWVLLVENESWIWQSCWGRGIVRRQQRSLLQKTEPKPWSLSLHLRSKGSAQGGGGGSLLYLSLISVRHALHSWDPCRSATHAPDLSWPHTTPTLTT